MSSQVYKDIEYTLIRSPRKTASIYIERDGTVSVRVPQTLEQTKIEQIIEGKRAWIYKGLAEWETLNTPQIKREFVNGEGFLYLGRTYRLKLVQGQNSPLKLKQGYFCLQATPDGQAPTDSPAIFKQFYRAKGLKRIPPRVAFYEQQVGVTVNQIRVMELQNRWASCSAQANLNFHWKLMMAPSIIIDYIIIHELAHLLQPNHTAAFWHEIEKVMPDYRRHEAWLKENGVRLVV
ncbi:MAG TPA: SprT family zinc-dependent metalloprotease [Anaerolineae bacterium]|nr:SprT family zinc-dependent metalloprotease [Anaerolineae bacterium]